MELPFKLILIAGFMQLSMASGRPEDDVISEEQVSDEAVNQTSKNLNMTAPEPPAMNEMEKQMMQAYIECMTNVLSKPYPDDGRLYCNATFDSWGCWNYTVAGTRAYSDCPGFIIGFDPTLKGFKDCEENGTWWVHPISQKHWSNYTTCVNSQLMRETKMDVQLFIAGYSCSLVAISIALFIFFYFKQLWCTRITIHKNLFFSFVLCNMAWIIWYTTVNTNVNVLRESPFWCQIFHVVNQYFTACNYLWMFCEGVYLHTMIVFAFVSEKHIMKVLIVIGWGFPALLVITYGVVRGLQHDGNIDNCWIAESKYSWIISAPVCLSIVTNLFFLCNIMRVLIIKLRAVNTAESHQTLKAARAVLILIPLLGVYYVILSIPPKEGPAKKVYQKLLAISSSFQGFFVALIFCFLNGEVISLIKKKWYNYQEVHGKMRRLSTYVNTTMTELPPSHRGGNRNNRPSIL